MAADSAAPAGEVKLSISSAALAELLHRCGASAADCDGLLFGRAYRPPAPTPALSDYDDHAMALAPATPSLSISVSGHSSLSIPSSLADPLGRFQPFAAASSSPAPLGFFSSSRCRAPLLRPSMRELSLAYSLSKTLALPHPVLFILVSPSVSHDLSTHSFDYRAFLLLGSHLVPTSLSVVNVGPGFRDQYHSFAAESPLPLLPPTGPSPPEGGYSIAEQKMVDGMVDGFGIGRLQGLVGAAVGQEMEQMYAGMLRKLEKLAREVEKSNLRVLEQENRNMVLRHRSAGLE